MDESEIRLSLPPPPPRNRNLEKFQESFRNTLGKCKRWDLKKISARGNLKSANHHHLPSPPSNGTYLSPCIKFLRVEKFRAIPHIGSGLLFSLWDLEKFREKPGGSQIHVGPSGPVVDDLADLSNA